MLKDTHTGSVGDGNECIIGSISTIVSMTTYTQCWLLL
jgi:hypothetical protein